jgi:hypothetical protein
MRTAGGAMGVKVSLDRDRELKMRSMATGKIYKNDLKAILENSQKVLIIVNFALFGRMGATSLRAQESITP